LPVEALRAADFQHVRQAAASNAHRLPAPDLGAAPRALDLGDRVVKLLFSLHHPRVALFGNFLSPQECEALIEAATPRLARSLTVQTHTGAEQVNAARTSDGMFFKRGETELIERIEARIARLLHWPVGNGEGVQVLHYLPGAEYKPHYDYFDPAAEGTARIIAHGGQRVATLVMYLNEPEAGGGTIFPGIGLEVAPQRGSALYFGYERPDPSTGTLHGGTPVLAGEKWVATKWLREREFT
jgi:prolyl 4-hydroxylase